MANNQLGARHKKVQRLRRLLRQSSLREAEGVFVVEGSKLLEEALEAGAAIESIFVSSGARLPVVDRATRPGHRIFHLQDGVMERVAGTVTPQPVAAVVRMCDSSIEVIRSASLVAVLVDVRDPGNAGTIMRSVEAAGHGAVVLTKGCVDVYNPKTVRSSAGSLFHVPFVRGADLSETMTALATSGHRRLATVVQGGTPYDDVDLKGRIAVVLGNEANGLSTDGVDFDAALSIPIDGRSESLNVSMAMTVLSFEAARQRRKATRS